MLTAHGLNPDNLIKSIQEGAKSYIPKGKMNEIDVYLKEIFFAKEEEVEKPGNWFAAWLSSLMSGSIQIGTKRMRGFGWNLT